MCAELNCGAAHEPNAWPPWLLYDYICLMRCQLNWYQLQVQFVLVI